MTLCPCQFGDRKSYLCRFCDACFNCDHTLVQWASPIWQGRDGHRVLATSTGQELLARVDERTQRE